MEGSCVNLGALRFNYGEIRSYYLFKGDLIILRQEKGDSRPIVMVLKILYGLSLKIAEGIREEKK